MEQQRKERELKNQQALEVSKTTYYRRVCLISTILFKFSLVKLRVESARHLVEPPLLVDRVSYALVILSRVFVLFCYPNLGAS
jgi:hypothetical protein